MIEGTHMKKLLVSVLAFAVLFGCACSLDKGSDSPWEDDEDSSDSGIYITTVQLEHPDQLQFTEGGTAGMTVYRCGACYYECTDGTKSWIKLYSNFPIELEDGQFIHVEADFELVFGGVAGYWGSKHVTAVRNERYLTLDEVADCRILELYDENVPNFYGAQLLVKDGVNYLIVKDPMLRYRLYDNEGNLLCTYDTAMAAVAYLDEDADPMIEYSSPFTGSCFVMRIDGVYYAYCRYNGLNTWTPLLNLQFENKPVGFELEDGEAMYVSQAHIYTINGGKAGYVNVPMFDVMEHYSRICYSELNSKTSEMHWEEARAYENGKMYQYFYGLDEYLIFYFDGEFYVYHEYGSELENDEFVGKYTDLDEVSVVIGWKTE